MNSTSTLTPCQASWRERSANPSASDGSSSSAPADALCFDQERHRGTDRTRRLRRFLPANHDRAEKRVRESLRGNQQGSAATEQQPFEQIGR